MIKTTRNPKFLRRDEKVTVTMNGKTKELIEEYAAVTQCIAKVLVNSCIPGKLEELKKGMHKALDDAFADAEKLKGKETLAAWSNS